jgi:hypothetical protein
MLPDICAAGDKWQAQFFSGAPDEPLIGITAAAPELMIKMGDGKPPTIIAGKSRQQVQQHHRIQAPGYGHEDGFAPTEKPPGENGFSGPLKQIAHQSMLRATGVTGNIWLDEA